MKNKSKAFWCTAVAFLLAMLTLAGCGGGRVVSEDKSTVAVYTYAGKGGVEISAVSAVLYDAESGRVLFAHNCNSELPMASTTKIMTAVIALEHGDMQAETVITREAVNVEGSSIYLSEGERFTQEELLYALLLESGNDAAVALAIAVAGSTDAFVQLMNEKALSLGLTSTRFANPHGLSAEGHYTTAKELAAITAYALRLDGFVKAVSTVSAKIEGDGHLPRYLMNHNKLLRSYEGLIGVKTGYTLAAGRCLVTAARRAGMTLIAVTLNDRNDWHDHTEMLDYGFSAFRMETVYTAKELVAVPIIGGKKGSTVACCEEDVRICTPTDSTITKLYVTDAVNAPVQKGEAIAALKIFENGTLIKEIPLFACYNVARK